MTSRIVVATFYKFTLLQDPETLRANLLDFCRRARLGGTLILAHEGFNGTVAGLREGVDELLGKLRELPGCGDLQPRESCAEEMPFYRMKIRVKPEIVTMGVPEVDPVGLSGTYIEPEDWDALIADPDVALIDTRNDYEAAIGTFEGAINPKTATFREFPDWFRARKDLHGKRKFAMFCTGGIRCEKATAYLKMLGFDEVYHLKGGILNYLERMPEQGGRWRGECFVFDQRAAVRRGLEPGSYELCRACRMPICSDDKASPYYSPGVSCPHCHDVTSAEQKRRFADRQRQTELARRRGTRHVGAVSAAEANAGRDAQDDAG